MSRTKVNEAAEKIKELMLQCYDSGYNAGYRAAERRFNKPPNMPATPIADDPD